MTNTVQFEQRDQMEEMFHYVADHLLTGTAITGDAAHGLVDVAAIEAVYEAAAEGGRVDVGVP